jgi:hypothetical protein
MTAPAARRTLGNVLIPVLPDLWLPVSLASTCAFPVQQPIQSFRSRHRRAHIVCLERVLLGFFPNPETRFVSVGEPTCFTVSHHDFSSLPQSVLRSQNGPHKS